MRTLLLHLSLIDGVGPATIQKIITRVGYTGFDEIYTMSVSDLMHMIGVSQSVADAIYTGLADVALLHKELELIAKHHITWTTSIDSDYPLHLKEIHLPPSVLYWQGGDLSVADHSIACIGSRQATSYAQRAIDILIPPLVDAGFTIVSGGALGADTMAHIATLQSGGKTIAVLGSGLLEPYPRSNIRLFERIQKDSGIVLSAFPLNMQALPGNFPARNRIIAGLSRGCLVVQAASKSGALITAEYALQQGREVFALPGIFDDQLSKGCHILIKQGAHLVHCAQDILQEFGYVTVINKKNELQNIPEHTISVDNKPLSKHELVMQACSEPKSIDALVLLLQEDYTIVQQILFDLHMQGLISQDFTGKWYRV
ncbi:MAG TPA: DNA-processing protein DprA [Candidatus Babeliales bacterium]|jgi:DNA processing protein|nr:DNA-processing protein DprA [Candidatus Babeliales bacterium]